MKQIIYLIVLLVPTYLKAQVSSDTTEAKKNALKIVEKEAQFNGGIPELIKFLTKNLNYPEPMRKKALQGKTTVEFVVCSDGGICDVKIINSAGRLFDEEAIRVIKMMPNWTPGEQAGQKVSSYYSLPISYVLDADEDSYKEHTLVPLFYADEQVQFEGGEYAMQSFIDRNIQLTAKRKSFSVLLEFDVSATGETSNIICETEMDKKIKQEAIRILKLMPKWKPAKLNGNNVDAKMKLAIVFKK